MISIRPGSSSSAIRCFWACVHKCHALESESALSGPMRFGSSGLPHGADGQACMNVMCGCLRSYRSRGY